MGGLPEPAPSQPRPLARLLCSRRAVLRVGLRLRGARSSQQVACSHKHQQEGEGSFVSPVTRTGVPVHCLCLLGITCHVQCSTVVSAAVFCALRSESLVIGSLATWKGKALPGVRSLAPSPGFFIRAVQAHSVSVFLPVTPDLVVHGLALQQDKLKLMIMYFSIFFSSVSNSLLKMDIEHWTEIISPCT